MSHSTARCNVVVSAVTCARLVSQITNSSLIGWRTTVNVTCHVSRTFADKRKTTSLVSTCDDKGHWTPAVPDCIGNHSTLQLTRHCVAVNPLTPTDAIGGPMGIWVQL